MGEFPEPTTAEVLVIGAGPTGLMLAAVLTRLGVDVVIVDGKAGPTRESRALVLQARTMEILDQLGVVDGILDETMVARVASPGYGRTSFGRVAVGRIGAGVSPFAGLHVLEQSKTERILGTELERLGGSVLWQHSLTALTDTDGGVKATLDAPDGTMRLRARYCVGTDGASSKVRRLRGIPFEGVTNEHTFYVSDAHGVTGLEPDAVNLRFGPDEMLITFPMAPGGNDRLLGTIRLSSSAAEVTEDAARAKLSTVFGVDYDTSSWFSTYRISHRVAARFHDGPVFLAGDAGHVHSPVGAQGMNTGLQDAHNLAFALAAVLRHGAPDSALDRYESERRPVALRLVSTTDRAFALVTGRSRVSRFVRRRLSKIILPFVVGALPRLPLSQRFFEYLSQTRIHYWMSDEARRAGRRGRVVGRRLSWTGTNFDVLRSLDWQVHVYGHYERRTTVRLHSALGIPVHTFPTTGHSRLVPGRFYLVRPDGFVAAEASGRMAIGVFARALAAAGVPPHTGGVSRQSRGSAAAPVRIVSPGEEDWQRVRALRLEMLRDTPIAFMETAEAAEAHPEEVWRVRAKRGSTPDSIQVVAVDRSGDWVGTMSGFVDRGDTGGPLLVGVYVSPGFRGRDAGVADALLAAVEDWARRFGDQLTLQVHEDNARAIAYYRRRGYRATGRSIPYNLDPSRNEIEMRRSLR